ncbi:hypothetical protein PMAC_000977 [Pneumocystis sp. 'macacae']|nr:hypothetical protein PMAC_000977 [Pneumocystis sp. 'macacae']
MKARDAHLEHTDRRVSRAQESGESERPAGDDVPPTKETYAATTARRTGTEDGWECSHWDRMEAREEVSGGAVGKGKEGVDIEGLLGGRQEAGNPVERQEAGREERRDKRACACQRCCGRLRRARAGHACEGQGEGRQRKGRAGLTSVAKREEAAKEAGEAVLHGGREAGVVEGRKEEASEAARIGGAVRDPEGGPGIERRVAPERQECLGGSAKDAAASNKRNIVVPESGAGVGRGVAAYPGRDEGLFEAEDVLEQRKEVGNVVEEGGGDSGGRGLGDGLDAEEECTGGKSGPEGVGGGGFLGEDGWEVCREDGVDEDTGDGGAEVAGNGRGVCAVEAGDGLEGVEQGVGRRLAAECLEGGVCVGGVGGVLFVGHQRLGDTAARAVALWRSRAARSVAMWLPGQRVAERSEMFGQWSSRDEEEVRRIFLKSLRTACADSIRGWETVGRRRLRWTGFAECAAGRTFSMAWKCREEKHRMKECMRLNGHREQYDRARETYMRQQRARWMRSMEAGDDGAGCGWGGHWVRQAVLWGGGLQADRRGNVLGGLCSLFLAAEQALEEISECLVLGLVFEERGRRWL